MKGRHFPAPACNLTFQKDAQRVFCQPLIFQLVPWQFLDPIIVRRGWKLSKISRISKVESIRTTIHVSVTSNSDVTAPPCTEKRFQSARGRILWISSSLLKGPDFGRIILTQKMKIFLTFFAISSARFLENSTSTKTDKQMLILIDSDLAEKRIFYEERPLDLQKILGKREKNYNFGPSEE